MNLLFNKFSPISLYVIIISFYANSFIHSINQFHIYHSNKSIIYCLCDLRQTVYVFYLNIYLFNSIYLNQFNLYLLYFILYTFVYICIYANACYFKFPFFLIVSSSTLDYVSSQKQPNLSVYLCICFIIK